MSIETTSVVFSSPILSLLALESFVTAQKVRKFNFAIKNFLVHVVKLICRKVT